MNTCKPIPTPYSPFLDEKDDHTDDTVIYDDIYIKEQMKLSKHSILYTNIRSLSKNIIQLRSLARELDPDFIMLTEIFDPLKKYVKINNYHDVITKVRNTSTFGGGLAIYIKSCYPFAMDMDK